MRFAAPALIIAVTCANVAVSRAQEIQLPPSAASHQAAVPETVLYEILLHHVAIFHDKAEELDRQGGDGSPYRHHITAKLGLSPQEMLYLDSVALQYREESKQVNEEIATSVDNFHAYHKTLPVGTKPTLPPEAKRLIAEHNQLVKNARDKFHVLVGDAEFTRIDGLIKSRFRADVRTGPVNSQRQTTPSTNGLEGGGYEK